MDLEDKPKIVKPKMNIGIDTDAINELYTYGGEQGQKIGNAEDDFECSILELAQ